MITQMIAATSLALGLGLSYWQYSVICGKEVAVGRVTALTPHRGHKGGTVYEIEAQYCDKSGCTHTYKSGFSSSSPGFRVGDAIRIWFDGDNPEDCGVLSFGYRFGVAWILIIAGVSIWIAHVGWGVGGRWLEHRFPTTVQTAPSTPP